VHEPSISILIVADRPAASAKLAGSLDRESLVVVETPPGSKALCAALLAHPDGVVVDLGATANESAVSTARTLAWIHQVPIVFTCSSTSAERVAELSNIPFVAGVLCEPWTDDDFRRVLDAILEKRRSAV
jgi:DNA-binding response OmpR family regulator